MRISRADIPEPDHQVAGHDAGTGLTGSLLDPLLAGPQGRLGMEMPVSVLMMVAHPQRY